MGVGKGAATLAWHLDATGSGSAPQDAVKAAHRAAPRTLFGTAAASAPRSRSGQGLTRQTKVPQLASWAGAANVTTGMYSAADQMAPASSTAAE